MNGPKATRICRAVENIKTYLSLSRMFATMKERIEGQRRLFRARSLQHLVVCRPNDVRNTSKAILKKKSVNQNADISSVRPLETFSQ